MKSSRILIIASLFAIAMMVAGAAAAPGGVGKGPKPPQVFKNVGNSGSLKVYPLGVQNPFVMIKQGKIVEQFANNTIVPGGSINTANGRWSDTTTVIGSDLNVSAYTINYTKKFNGTEGTYTLMVSYFPNASAQLAQVNLSSGGNPAGVLGFAVDLEGWDLAAVDDHLNMTLDIEAKGGSPNNIHKQNIVLSEGSPVFPVVLNDLLVNINSMFSGKKNHLDLAFSFPAV